MGVEVQPLDCYGNYARSDKCYCCLLHFACMLHSHLRDTFATDTEVLIELENSGRILFENMPANYEAMIKLVHEEKKCPYCEGQFKDYGEMAGHIRKNHDIPIIAIAG